MYKFITAFLAASAVLFSANAQAQKQADVAIPAGGPTKTELIALFKEELKKLDEQMDETVNSAKTHDYCKLYSTLNVNDLTINAAEVSGGDAIIKFKPKLTYGMNLIEIKEKQNCGKKVPRPLAMYVAESQNPKKGDAVLAGEASRTKEMTLKKMNGKWRVAAMK